MLHGNLPIFSVTSFTLHKLISALFSYFVHTLCVRFVLLLLIANDRRLRRQMMIVWQRLYSTTLSLSRSNLCQFLQEYKTYGISSSCHQQRVQWAPAQLVWVPS